MLFFDLLCYRDSNVSSNSPPASSIMKINPKHNTPNTNAILEHIGLVVNDGAPSEESKMYTFRPKSTKTTYYRRMITSYCAKRNVGKVSKNACEIFVLISIIYFVKQSSV